MSEHIQPATDPTSRERERPDEHERTPGVAHESEAFDFRLILWVGFGLLLFGAVLQVVLWQLLGSFEKRHAVPPGAVSEMAREEAEQPLGQRVDGVPGPHLEGIERERNHSHIAAARQRAEVQMERYGWIDRQKDIVHIPIDKAMEEVLRSKELGSPKQGRQRKRPENAGRKR